jgi:hypothetical protein
MSFFFSKYMTSRAVVLHTKDKKVVTAGGLTAKKLVVSKSSGEIVSRLKQKQGKESPWAVNTRICREKLGLTGMVLFNVGKDGKALYKCVKKLSE